jgi:PKHD-type hydroxylase
MECEAIIAHAAELPKQRGTVGYTEGHHVDETIRKSDVIWLPREDTKLRWLYDRLVLAALNANERCFYFRMDNYPNLSYGDIQFTEYHSDDAGEYKWHEDAPLVRSTERASERKLSLCVQLTESSEYEGGAFELVNAKLNGAYSDIGDVIVFPSFQSHRVTPVTRGIRRSLVLWFFGPPLS